jgi:predicted hotdog family 3-hydroxylacyl-ACP dehydratase
MMAASTDLPDIRTLVPHGGPMSLLERLVAADFDTLCAELAIGPGTLFCDGREVGAWVGVEYMAQAVAAHAGFCARLRGEPVKPGFLLGTRSYQCSRPGFAVGTVLRVHVQRVLQGDNGLGGFECRIEDGATAEVIASAIITVYQPSNVDDFLQRSVE